MWIKIMRDTVADGKPVKEGEVLDISDNNARTLILLGKAVDVPADAATQAAPAAPAQVAKAPSPEEAAAAEEEEALGIIDADLAPGADAEASTPAKKGKKPAKKRGA